MCLDTAGYDRKVWLVSLRYFRELIAFQAKFEISEELLRYVKVALYDMELMGVWQEGRDVMFGKAVMRALFQYGDNEDLNRVIEFLQQNFRKWRLGWRPMKTKEEYRQVLLVKRK